MTIQLIISAELLKSSLRPFDISLDENQIAQLDRYAQILLNYNEKINLTTITDPDEIVIKHFVDSLALLNYVCIPQGAAVADIGTGAGFPGVVLLIARPDLRAFLFDSTKKKLDFIDFAMRELSLNGKTVHLRAEEAGHKNEYREKFDFVTARAVAELRVLSELCLPLVKNGGIFAPMKGCLSNDETQTGKRAIKALGGQISDEKAYELPSADKRTILIIKKISQTSPKYPRIFSQILKKPL